MLGFSIKTCNTFSSEAEPQLFLACSSFFSKFEPRSFKIVLIKKACSSPNKAGRLTQGQPAACVDVLKRGGDREEALEEK